MKYSACAECEIIHCVNCEISHFVRCEMKFALHICEANISQRNYFTWRSHISLAEGEFRCTSVHPRDNKKHSAIEKCFLKFDQRSKLSLGVLATPFDIVALSCDFVRYREYREYRRIKCCSKFAPKSHQRLTPIQLDKLEVVIITRKRKIDLLIRYNNLMS